MAAARKWYQDPLLWVGAAVGAAFYFTGSNFRYRLAAYNCEPIKGISDWFVGVALRPDVHEILTTTMDEVIPEREEWTEFELAQASIKKVAGGDCDFQELFDNAPEEGQQSLLSIVTLADERLEAAGF